ncbi:MAG: hypothetical protein EOM88_04290 [Clostridia bacterium]|nr:hypothetical protein [Clostridia bacterium]
MNYILKVINFTESDIIFEDEEKNIIYWPKNNVPQVPEIGEIINFKIGDEQITKNNKSINPQELLNELLNISKK